MEMEPDLPGQDQVLVKEEAVVEARAEVQAEEEEQDRDAEWAEAQVAARAVVRGAIVPKTTEFLCLLESQ